MNINKVLQVVELDTSAKCVSIVDINHGEAVIGRNFVAVLANEWPCKVSTCEWCDQLRNRCVSRRAA